MTAIEWTDVTWNPTTGCDKVSPGCDNCYAMTMAKRLKGMGSAHYQTDGDPKTSGPGFGVAMHADALEKPLHWGKPKRVFVNSMSDLFHDEVSDQFIAQVFAVMAASPQHTFQILTKRHGRMRSLLSSLDFDLAVAAAWTALGTTAGSLVEDHTPPYPLPNVWLGVSVENQQWADTRIPALLDTPAAVRFLSCEPLLGPVDLSRWIDDELGALDRLEDLDWVIVGGESGHSARPMHPEWARSLRDQCTDAGVAFLFKQWGEWVPESANVHRDNDAAAFLALDGAVRPLRNGVPDSAPRARGEDVTVRCSGKKLAGRRLDLRTWDEFPSAVTL